VSRNSVSPAPSDTRADTRADTQADTKADTKADHYRDAIRLAQATWDFMATKDAILVRWVRNADVAATIRQSLMEGWIMAAVSIVFGVVVIGGGADFGARAIYGDTLMTG